VQWRFVAMGEPELNPSVRIKRSQVRAVLENASTIESLFPVRLRNSAVALPRDPNFVYLPLDVKPLTSDQLCQLVNDVQVRSASTDVKGKVCGRYLVGVRLQRK